MTAGHRAWVVGLVALAVVVLVGAAVVQLDPLTYRTTPLWHQPVVTVAFLVALAAMGASIAWTAAQGRPWLPASVLLLAASAPILAGTERAPAVLRVVALGAPLIGATAAVWTAWAIATGRRQALWWWVLAASAVPALALLLLYRPLLDVHCDVVCDDNGWALAHVPLVTGVSNVAALGVGSVLAVVALSSAVRTHDGPSTTVVTAYGGAAALAVALPLQRSLGLLSTLPSILVLIGLAMITSALFAACAATTGRLRRLRRITENLADASHRSDLGRLVGSALGFPGLVIAFDAGAGHVDAEGREVELAVAVPLRADGGRVVALADGAGGVALDAFGSPLDPLLVLLLDNASLMARLRVQLAQVRAVRSALVRNNDDMRQSLERDLHDGAQQVVLAVGLDLQLLTSVLRESPEEHQAVAAARVRAADAMVALRSVAHRLVPAGLPDVGLSESLRLLVIAAPLPVTLADHTRDIVMDDAPRRAALHLVVAAIADARHQGATGVSVLTTADGRTLRIRLSWEGSAEPDLGVEPDRLAALDGDLDVRVADVEVVVTASLPVDYPTGTHEATALSLAAGED